MDRPGHSQLKSLQVQLQRLQDQLKDAEKQSSEINNQRAELKKKVKETESNIKNLTQKEIQVTEHALLQYITRVLGVNLKQVKNAILTDEVVSTIDQVGSATIPVHRPELPNDPDFIDPDYKSDFKVVAKNRVVVTIKI